MKIGIITICLILLMPFTSFGNEKVELAKELMEITNVNQTMEQVEIQTRRIQNQLMAQFEISEDQKAKAVEFQNRVTAKIFEIMSFDKMKGEYIELFTSVYSVDELRGIVEFYKSPIGKGLIEKQPVILKKAMELSQKKMQMLIPELEKMSKEFEVTLKE